MSGHNTAPGIVYLEMGFWYVQSMSLSLNLRILWMTIQKVLGRSRVMMDAEPVIQNLDDERRGKMTHA